MYGAESTFYWHPFDKVETGGSFGYVRGVLANRSGENVPRLPPLQGRINITIEPSESFTTGVVVRLASEQDRTGEFEQSTPGYAVLDYSAQYYRHLWGHVHTVSLTLENLTHTTYNRHLNRVKEIMPEPGRNLRILHKTFF